MVMHATSDLNHTQERCIAVYMRDGVKPDAYRGGDCFSTIFGLMLTISIIFCFFCSLGGLKLLIILKRYALFFVK